MKYLVAILLPPEIAQNIAAIQQKYKNERWNIRVGPHITLVFRGDLIGSEQELIDRLRDTAQYHDPFPITLKGVDFFDKQLKVIFAQVLPSKALIRLQRDLVVAMQQLFIADDNYSTHEVYRPHVTLSNRLTEAEAAAILPELESRKLHYHFLSTGFTLLRRAPRDLHWKEIITLPFGTPNQVETPR